MQAYTSAKFVILLKGLPQVVFYLITRMNTFVINVANKKLVRSQIKLYNTLIIKL